MDIVTWKQSLLEKLQIGHPDPAVAEAVATACLMLCEGTVFADETDVAAILERVVDPDFDRADEEQYEV